MEYNVDDLKDMMIQLIQKKEDVKTLLDLQDCIERLKAQEVDINEIFYNGESLIYKVALAEKWKMTNMLLQAGVNINGRCSIYPTSDKTIFHRLFRIKDIKMIEKCIKLVKENKQDIDFDIEDYKYRTCMYYLLNHQSGTNSKQVLEIIQLLTAEMPNKIELIINASLEYINGYDNFNIFKDLIEKNEEKIDWSKISKNCIYNVMNSEKNINDRIDFIIKHKKLKKDIFGRTPLHCVCELNFEEIFLKRIIKKLMNLGFDINESDIEEKTPIFYAIESHNWQIMKFLFAEGAIVKNKGSLISTVFFAEGGDRYFTHNGKDLKQAFPVANFFPMTNFLIEKYQSDHVGISEPDIKGKTPLHYAIEYLNINMVKFFVEKIIVNNPGQLITNALLFEGAKYVTKDQEEEEYTMPHNPYLHKLFPIANFLIEKYEVPPINVDTVDEHKRTALHYVANCRQVDLMQLMLVTGADIDVKDEYGNPPWHYIDLEHSNIELIIRKMIFKIKNDKDLMVCLSKLQNRKAEVNAFISEICDAISLPESRYIQMLLHQNEDYDEDLLGDALKLLTIEKEKEDVCYLWSILNDEQALDMQFFKVIEKYLPVLQRYRVHASRALVEIEMKKFKPEQKMNEQQVESEMKSIPNAELKEIKREVSNSKERKL